MNVDAIYVITLNEAHERQKLMTEWYPKGVFEWYKVDRLKNPLRGCFRSHQEVMQLAKDKGYKRILVLEDDAFPLDTWENIVSKTNNVLGELGDNWDYLMLGYVSIRSKKTQWNDLVKIKCAVQAHAYICNLDNFKKSKWSNNTQLDLFLFCNNDDNDDYNYSKALKIDKYTKRKIYGIYPSLFIQKTEKSQITNYHLAGNDFYEFLGNDNITIVSQYCNINILLLFVVFFVLLGIPLIIVISVGNKQSKIVGGVIFGILLIIFFILFLIDLYYVNID